MSLASLRGKYVLLNFWSTTCGPCIGEIPDLQETYRKFKDDDRVVMISLALDSSDRKLKAFVKEREMLWRQVMLPGEFDDPIARAYKVSGIPKTLIVGPDGKVAKRWDSVKPAEHAAEVLAAVKALPAGKK